MRSSQPGLCGMKRRSTQVSDPDLPACYITTFCLDFLPNQQIETRALYHTLVLCQNRKFLWLLWHQNHSWSSSSAMPAQVKHSSPSHLSHFTCWTHQFLATLSPKPYQLSHRHFFITSTSMLGMQQLSAVNHPTWPQFPASSCPGTNFQSKCRRRLKHSAPVAREACCTDHIRSTCYQGCWRQGAAALRRSVVPCDRK